MYNTTTKSMIWAGVIILTVGAYMVFGLIPAAVVAGASGWWALNQ
ncbi:hypothetical protein [Pontixanthobacter aquaemixtae]|nr:hypothetical protein [Pontixanthobacter aquaemixtae]